MKKAAIFDLDGTLVYSLPDIADAMNRSLEKAGLPTHPLERYNYMVGDGVINLARRAVGNRQDQLEYVLSCYRADYKLHCHEKTCLYNGVPEMLTRLNSAGLQLCIFSNKDQGDVESVVSCYMPDIPFACVLGRSDVRPVKPDPAGALYIVEKLGIAPAECWYIGDTDTDMFCGKRAGMDTVGAVWGFRGEA